MDNDGTPIDEYFFWKSLIDDKIASGQDISKKYYQLLYQAEYKLMIYLIEKYSLENEEVDTTKIH